MGILANLYFDVVGISQGIVFLLFCVPVVVLSEYGIYRVVWPEQGKVKALLTSVYANSVSGVLGIFTGDILDSIAREVSWVIGGSIDEWIYWIILFVIMFLFTWLIEGAAVFLLRRKLRIKRIFFGAGIANAASYVAILAMLFLYHQAAS